MNNHGEKSYPSSGMVKKIYKICKHHHAQGLALAYNPNQSAWTDWVSEWKYQTSICMLWETTGRKAFEILVSATANLNH